MPSWKILTKIWLGFHRLSFTKCNSLEGQSFIKSKSIPGSLGAPRYPGSHEISLGNQATPPESLNGWAGTWDFHPLEKGKATSSKAPCLGSISFFLLGGGNLKRKIASKEYSGNTIVVYDEEKCPQVKKSLCVRFAWHSWGSSNKPDIDGHVWMSMFLLEMFQSMDGCLLHLSLTTNDFHSAVGTMISHSAVRKAVQTRSTKSDL